MASKEPNALSGEVRKQLASLLCDASTHDAHPEFAADVAMQAANEACAAYFKGEDLAKRNGHVNPTPARSVRLIHNVLHALGALEAGADSDTLQICRDSLSALRFALKDRRAILQAWQAAREHKMKTDGGGNVRKSDARTERMRLLCGHVGLIWMRCAADPKNSNNRRRFATLIFDGAGIDHPGAKHPQVLDEWLDTPVGPLDPKTFRAAAKDARAILEAAGASKLA